MNLNLNVMNTGWMYLSNNDSTTLSTTSVAPPSSSEWTMSRYGADVDRWHYAYQLYSDGGANIGYSAETLSVRPVFYLTSDIKITDGTGTIDDPFLIN